MACCEICGKDDFELIAVEIREGPGRIAKCRSCGLVIQDVKWASKEIERYYNDEYHKTNSLDAERELPPEEHFNNRIKTIQPIVDEIHRFLRPGMKVLEIGCGAGELLHSIKPHVGEVVGIEMSKRFVDFMNKNLGIEAYTEDVNKMDFGTRKFDFIILIATLDHLPNPSETLKTIKRIISETGIIYIELPNLNEALNIYLPEESRKAYNKFFWHKAHFFYFTRETLTRLMEKAGFNCQITCRHEYTLRNFLNWYFKGTRQTAFVDATTGVDFFPGDSEFEKGMNQIFYAAEGRFHKLMNSTFRGDTLCCLAKPRVR